jgi:hypothetical protein
VEGLKGGVSVKPQVVPALPGWACSRASGRENFGRGCSRPKGRETAVEAEATLSRKVAAEAEAGKTTGPTPSCGVLPGGEGGLPAGERGGGRMLHRFRVVLANAFSFSSATETTLRGEIKTLEVIAKVYVVAILAVIAIVFIILEILQKTESESILIMSMAVTAVSAITLAIALLLRLPGRRGRR